MAAALHVTDDAFLAHLTGAHPECPERVVAIQEALRAAGLLDRLVRVDPAPASDGALETVHEAAYLDRFRRACRQGGTVFDSMDNPISARSEEVARLAAGGALDLVDRLAAGDARAGFAAIRPPGHHAGRDAARGFCFYNNAALAARRAQREHGVDRVLVVDIDVHHGNGTQEVFWDDASVLYASIHQWPLYPGTGAASETGGGDGVGATLNLPLDAGGGDAEYLAALGEVLAVAREFRPGFVVVSAGFDAHELDPLAGMRVTEAGYAEMTRRILDLSAHLEAPLLSVLEGGYHLEALGRSVAAHVGVLLEA